MTKMINQLFNKKILFLILGFFLIGSALFSFQPQAANAQAETEKTDICAEGTTNKTNTSLTSTRLVDFIKCRPAFQTIWKAMIGLVDIFVLIGFIIFALANVFHIKYDEYQAKKAIPGLIVGVILANLSYSICIFLVDAVQHLTDLFIKNPETFFGNLADLYSWMWTLAGGSLAIGIPLAVAGVGFAGIILGLILFFLPALMVLAIAGILWARALIVVVLISAAPLAFLLNSFPVEIPYLSGLAKKWWEWFPKWLFIGPVMFFMFWLAFVINSGGNPNQNIITTNTSIDLRTEATKLCNKEKTEKQTTGKIGEWNKGKCLSTDYENTGAAVYVNGSTVHECTGRVQYIEFDLNCNITKTNPENLFDSYNKKDQNEE